MAHPKLSILVNTIHATLKPRGFNKYKLVWKRFSEDLTQMVALDKESYGFPVYHFCYGICVEKYSRSTKSPQFDRNVEWHLVTKLKTRPERERMIEGFDLDSTMTDTDRAALIEDILANHVIPTFEATDSIEKLRHVLNDLLHPRSTLFVNFELEGF